MQVDLPSSQGERNPVQVYDIYNGDVYLKCIAIKRLEVKMKAKLKIEKLLCVRAHLKETVQH